MFENFKNGGNVNESVNDEWFNRLISTYNNMMVKLGLTHLETITESPEKSKKLIQEIVIFVALSGKTDLSIYYNELEQDNYATLIVILTVCGYFGNVEQKDIISRYVRGRSGYTIDIGLVLAIAYDNGLMGTRLFR